MALKGCLLEKIKFVAIRAFHLLIPLCMKCNLAQLSLLLAMALASCNRQEATVPIHVVDWGREAQARPD